MSKQIDYGSIYDAVLAENNQLRARVAELEARLAQTWQPLPDGIHPTKKLKDYFEIEGEWLTVTETLYDDGSEKLSTLIELPDNIRLCRLVERAEVPPYSHRNGEIESPTEAGWYWFRGNVSSSYRGEVPYSGSVTILDSMYENRGLCVISTNESPTSNIEKWQGQWYGPIVAPWEDCHE